MKMALRKQAVMLMMIAVCLYPLSLPLVQAQPSSAAYAYNMSFDNSGSTAVEISFNSGVVGSGSSWLAIPKNFSKTVTALTGTITSLTYDQYKAGGDGGGNLFYDNMTFSYSANDAPFSMRVTFNFTDGAMMVEPYGLFYSPLMSAPRSAKTEARLTLPEGITDVRDVEPAPARVDDFGSQMKLYFRLSSETRIAVTFRVPWPKQIDHVTEGNVNIEAPSRYLNLSNRIAALYRNAIPHMDDLFKRSGDKISVKFFVPLSFQQLSIGGYTPIDASSFEPGSIFLNVFYVRALPGMIETIAVHELTHQYEARVGISPELLWVQEGLANYIAVQMGKTLGYDTASMDADLGTAAKELSGQYGAVQQWRPENVSSLFGYYAASYEIFVTLGQKYGGLSFYSRFFQGLPELKDGLRSTNIAVYQLGLAAGADLFPEFASWGFQLIDLSRIGAEITRLRSEADWYGPLLPFRQEALDHLDLAQSSIYLNPEAATGHIRIAAFYVETMPMLIAGTVLVLILLVAIVAILHIRSRRRRAQHELGTESQR